MFKLLGWVAFVIVAIKVLSTTSVNVTSVEKEDYYYRAAHESFNLGKKYEGRGDKCGAKVQYSLAYSQFMNSSYQAASSWADIAADHKNAICIF